MHEAALREHTEHLLDVVPSRTALGRRERQLERRALHVIDQDVQVVRVDRGRAPARRRRSTTGCAPRTDRVARCSRPGRQPTGRCDGRRVPRAATSRQSFPDSPPSRRRRARRCRSPAPARWSRRLRGRCLRGVLFRFRGDAAEVASPVAPDLIARAWWGIEIVFQVHGEDLGRKATLSEDDQLQAALQELPRNPAGFGEIGMPIPSCRLTTGGFTKERTSRRAGRRSLTRARKALPERLGQFARVCNRRRRADERRIDP